MTDDTLLILFLIGLLGLQAFAEHAIIKLVRRILESQVVVLDGLIILMNRLKENRPMDMKTELEVLKESAASILTKLEAVIEHIERSPGLLALEGQAKEEFLALKVKFSGVVDHLHLLKTKATDAHAAA